MLLSDIHNSILRGSDTLGSRHFLEEPGFLHALFGMKLYEKFYRLVALADKAESIEEVDLETFKNILLKATEVATEDFEAVRGIPVENRLGAILANFEKPFDFLEVDNVDHGLFTIH